MNRFVIPCGGALLLLYKAILKFHIMHCWENDAWNRDQRLRGSIENHAFSYSYWISILRPSLQLVYHILITQTSRDPFGWIFLEMSKTLACLTVQFKKKLFKALFQFGATVWNFKGGSSAIHEGFLSIPFLSPSQPSVCSAIFLDFSVNIQDFAAKKKKKKKPINTPATKLP